VSVRIDPLTGKRAATNDPVATFEYFMQPYVPDEDKNTTTVESNTPTTPAATPIEDGESGVY
jgi:hypothetical protein